MEHIRRFPESCSRKFSFEGHFGKIYPLFAIACRFKVSLELVQAVHEAYPVAVVGALHYALRKNQKSVPVIRYLLNATPDRSLARENGRLPIHTALENQAKLDMIQFLVEEHPECVREREPNTQRLPLHIAIETFAGFLTVKFLVSKYKDALKLADYDIEAVVEQEGWLVHKGKLCHDIRCGLPLHTACKRRATLKTIHFLVSEYPTAVSTKNRAGEIVQALFVSCSVVFIRVIDFLLISLVRIEMDSVRMVATPCCLRLWGPTHCDRVFNHGLS